MGDKTVPSATEGETSTSKVSETPVHLKAGGHSILVNPRQRGNPLLKSIRNVPYEFDDRLIADYVMGPTTCALFLSVRYHNLNPDYIHDRLKVLGKNYLLRVLLVLIDVKDPNHAINALTRISILANLTLMLVRNSDEAGVMIETYKVYQNKPADMIKVKKDGDTHTRLVAALTTIRSVNKTDASILLSNFGTLNNILRASETTLSLCPGIGPKKASDLYKVLHQPFLTCDNDFVPSVSKKRKT